MDTDKQPRSYTHAVIVEMLSLDGDRALVCYRDDTGKEGLVAVVAAGWRDGDSDDWPPRQGDRIAITFGPVVALERRA